MKFYYDFGQDWKGYFVRLAETRIKEITTKFDELQFYNDRPMIKRNVTAGLNKAFAEFSGGALNVTDLQLRGIKLADELETAVQEKLIELQAQKKWQIQQNISKIIKNTELIRKVADNQITILYAEANAKATILKNKAEAEGLKSEYEGYAKAYRSL